MRLRNYYFVDLFTAALATWGVRFRPCSLVSKSGTVTFGPKLRACQSASGHYLKGVFAWAACFAGGLAGSALDSPGW